VGAEKRPIRMGQTALFGRGDTIEMSASAVGESLEVFVLGGKPIREPVAMAGPFVMNTKSEVLQAFEDYQVGRLGVPVE